MDIRVDMLVIRFGSLNSTTNEMRKHLYTDLWFLDAIASQELRHVRQSLILNLGFRDLMTSKTKTCEPVYQVTVTKDPRH